MMLLRGQTTEFHMNAILPIASYSTRPHTYMQLYYRTHLPFHSTFISKTPRKDNTVLQFFFIYPHSLELCIHYDIPQHPLPLTLSFLAQTSQNVMSF